MGSQRGRIQQDKTTYYNRLKHKCQKDLYKQSKRVKTFETQKLIRSLKGQQDSDREQRLQGPELEQRLQDLKELPLSFVVEECFRRLGILRIDPTEIVVKGENETDDEKDVVTNSAPQRIDNDGDRGVVSGANGGDHDHAGSSTREKPGSGSCSLPTKNAEGLVELILKHSRMRTVLETWNEEITRYRRWSLRQQERLDGTASSKKSTKRSREKVDGVPPDSSRFVQLGESESPQADHGHGPERFSERGMSLLFDASLSKPNRQGQRARKAKALAQEAKRAGRPLPSSINWRAKKSEREETSHDVMKFNKSQKPSLRQRETRAVQSEEWTSDASLHPSWQARKQQKVGIVEFKGKKIVFD